MKKHDNVREGEPEHVGVAEQLLDLVEVLRVARVCVCGCVYVVANVACVRMGGRRWDAQSLGQKLRQEWTTAAAPALTVSDNPNSFIMALLCSRP